jgi:hypothetical protein
MKHGKHPNPSIKRDTLKRAPYVKRSASSIHITARR